MTGACRPYDPANFIEFKKEVFNIRKRNCRVVVYFSKDELDALTQKTRRVNLSREGFIRAAVAGVEIKEGPSADVPMLIQELRRVGSSLDLLLKLANDVGLPAVAYQLRGAMERNRAVEKLIVDTYTASC